MFAFTILFLSFFPMFFSAALTDSYVPLWNWILAAFGFLTAVSVMERKSNDTQRN